MKDLHPTDEIIKAAIIEAVAKELKTAVRVDLITQELTKMFEGDLISSELLNWAITETKKEHQQILDTSNVDYDTLLKQSPPVKLGDDDLYHASICSTVVNTSNDTEACKRLLQSLSYKSLQELSVSQSDYRSAFPRCMIANALSTDGSNATTCYVAFENISEFRVWGQLTDAQKSTFGKSNYFFAKVFNFILFVFLFQYLKVKLRNFQASIWKLSSRRKIDLFSPVKRVFNNLRQCSIMLNS